MQSTVKILGSIMMVTAAAGAAEAAIVTTSSYVAHNYNAIPADPLSLIRAGSSTLEGVTATGELNRMVSGAIVAGSGVAALNDSNVNTKAYSGALRVVTFTLDTSVNTLGYDLTSIASISGWPSYYAQIDYDVSYSTVSDPNTLIPLLSIVRTALPGTTKLESTEDSLPGGILASGVKKIVFTLDSLNGQPGNQTSAMWHELEALGVATVPEPATMSLVVAGCGLLAMRKRRTV